MMKHCLKNKNDNNNKIKTRGNNENTLFQKLGEQQSIVLKIINMEVIV